MSNMMHKIKDAVTGHHTTAHGTTTQHHTVDSTPLSSAQVRDAGMGGMHSTNSSLHSSSASSLGSSHMGSSHLGASTMSSMGTQSAGSALSHDNAMTRSEEHLLVGKEKVNLGKAGLHKYVTSEHVATTVPIVKEHAVVEREPITEANRAAAMSGPDFKEAHHEVNLMAERVVTQKEEVPIERVRIRKEQEVSNQYVEADLRKEHIEVADGSKVLGGGLAGQTGSSRLATDVNSQSRRM